MFTKDQIDELFLSHFPKLHEKQLGLLYDLGQLYIEWNTKVNLVSRKDIENIYHHHILHSLSIAKFIQFEPTSRVLDLGTGGGLPGIPLAIVFPQVDFLLVDGRSKKIMVVNDIIERLGITNAHAKAARAEEIKDDKFDFVTARAVASLDKLYLWCHRIIKTKQINGLPNGLIALKGGDITEELETMVSRSYTEQFPIYDFFPMDFYETKHIVYVQM